MRFFLDEGVPIAVANFLRNEGYEASHLVEELLAGSADTLVSAVAMKNNAILVAFDGDMKSIAKSCGVGGNRFKRLSLLHFRCKEKDAINRLQASLSLIKHEWAIADKKVARRLWVEIGKSHIKTHR